jgi:hypothetical protein
MTIDVRLLFSLQNRSLQPLQRQAATIDRAVFGFENCAITHVPAMPERHFVNLG